MSISNPDIRQAAGVDRAPSIGSNPPPAHSLPVPPSLQPMIKSLNQIEMWVSKILAFPMRILGIGLMIGGTALVLGTICGGLSLGLSLMVQELIKSGAPLVLMSGAVLMNLGRVMHSEGEAGLGLALYPVLMALSIHSLPVDPLRIPV